MATIQGAYARRIRPGRRSGGCEAGMEFPGAGGSGARLRRQWGLSDRLPPTGHPAAHPRPLFVGWGHTLPILGRGRPHPGEGLRAGTEPAAEGGASGCEGRAGAGPGEGVRAGPGAGRAGRGGPGRAPPTSVGLSSGADLVSSPVSPQPQPSWSPACPPWSPAGERPCPGPRPAPGRRSEGP